MNYFQRLGDKAINPERVATSLFLGATLKTFFPENGPPLCTVGTSER